MTTRGRRPLVSTNNADVTRRIVNFNYSENFNRVTELTPDNYPRWCNNMLHILTINQLAIYVLKEKVIKRRKKDIKEDLEGYIQDQFNDSLVYERGTSENDISNDITARWMIINSLGEKTQKIIQNQGKTSFEIWNLLRRSFTKSVEFRRVELKNKLNELKYDEDKNINIFISEMQNLIDELESIDTDLTNCEKVGILNRSLPDHLRFINVFKYKDNWQMCSFYAREVIPEIIFSNKKESNNQKENTKNIFSLEHKKNANQNKMPKTFKKPQKLKRNGRCNYCNKKGHYFYECLKRKANKLKKRNHKSFSKFNHNKGNYPNKKHYADYVRKDNYNNLYSELFTKDYNSEGQNEINHITRNNINTQKINNKKELIPWILDSGASINITNRLDILTDIKECKEKIYFANKEFIYSSHIGDFIGFINNYKILIKNIYYSPKINKNLLSLGQLIKQNYKIVFNYQNNQPFAIIYDQYNNKIQNIKSTEFNTFKLWTPTQQLHLFNKSKNITNEINYINMKTVDKLNLWHRRFGHFDIKPIKQKLLKTDIKQKCPLCIHSKLRNKPYQSTTNNTNHIFELIHMDLVGPIPESIYGNKYFFTILDDFSRYGWVLFLKSKDETFSAFHNWFNNVKNLYNTRIKYIRTDNGTEFVNRTFKEFCHNYGIKHQLTIPYNPQQNGKAERFNQTLINSAKVMLNDSMLSKHFWEDAVSTANYIHNRLPHQGIKYKIPFEIIHKQKVNYSNIRVFGCKVFFFIPKTFRSKFNNNAAPGIFLGYSENPTGYKILDTTNNKIILSRNVEFFESNPGNTHASSLHPDTTSNLIPINEIWESNSYFDKNSYSKQ